MIWARPHTIVCGIDAICRENVFPAPDCDRVKPCRYQAGLIQTIGMSGALLRSGDLKAFQPLGATGDPVYRFAPQLRAAMQRRFGSKIADLFAIPKANDEGDRVDWYAPQPGLVVPWSSASIDERTVAKASLLRARDRIAETAKNIQDNETHDDQKQIFARLLQQVFQFPADDHVYLVAGRPVITFWGFRRHNTASEADAFAGLYIEKASPPGMISPPASGTKRARWRGFRWWWLLVPLLLALLLFWRGCNIENAPPEESATAVVETRPFDRPEGVQQSEIGPDSRIHPAPSRARVIDEDRAGHITRSDGGRVDGQPDAVTGAAAEARLSDDSDTEVASGDDADQALRVNGEQEGAVLRSLEDASRTSEQADGAIAGESDESREPQPAAAQDDREPPAQEGDALTIPAEAVASGSTDFLNGRWRSSTGLMEADTGRPVALEYDFRNGKGQAKIRRSDGAVCTGDVSATFRDGNLVMDNSVVRCPDGAAFSPVKIECGIGKTGSADCLGEQSEGGKFTVKMHQTNQSKSTDE